MKKKGNSKRPKKAIIKKPKRRVSKQWGYIPKKRHFCIICFLIEGVKNNKKLTVHHHEKRANGGTNKPKNLEIICHKHHTQLHHPFFYPRVKRMYKDYRKAKFNKIQSS